MLDNLAHFSEGLALAASIHGCHWVVDNPWGDQSHSNVIRRESDGLRLSISRSDSSIVIQYVPRETIDGNAILLPASAWPSGTIAQLTWEPPLSVIRMPHAVMPSTTWLMIQSGLLQDSELYHNLTADIPDMVVKAEIGRTSIQDNLSRLANLITIAVTPFGNRICVTIDQLNAAISCLREYEVPGLTKAIFSARATPSGFITTHLECAAADGAIPIAIMSAIADFGKTSPLPALDMTEQPPTHQISQLTTLTTLLRAHLRHGIDARPLMLKLPNLQREAADALMSETEPSRCEAIASRLRQSADATEDVAVAAYCLGRKTRPVINQARLS